MCLIRRDKEYSASCRVPGASSSSSCAKSSQNASCTSSTLILTLLIVLMLASKKYVSLSDTHFDCVCVIRFFWVIIRLGVEVLHIGKQVVSTLLSIITICLLNFLSVWTHRIGNVWLWVICLFAPICGRKRYREKFSSFFVDCVCWKDIIPGLYKMYPNLEMQIDVFVSQSPSVVISTSGTQYRHKTLRHNNRKQFIMLINSMMWILLICFCYDVCIWHIRNRFESDWRISVVSDSKLCSYSMYYNIFEYREFYLCMYTDAHTHRFSIVTRLHLPLLSSYIYTLFFSRHVLYKRHLFQVSLLNRLIWSSK